MADLQLTRATASGWAESRGIDNRYVGVAVSELAGRAVDAGVLVLPEPGAVMICYANRDPETERETAVGW